MTAGRVEVRVRRLNPLVVIELGGDITSQAATQLAAAYDEALTYDPTSVLLDFSRVGYINSTGIALLVGILARARREERPLLASGLTEHYREIFEVTRLADFMTIYPDQEAAVRGLATAGA